MNYENICMNCESETFRNLFFSAANNNPDKIALEYRFGKVQYTYKELADNIVSLGSYLYSTGLSKKRIALLGARELPFIYFILTALCSDMVMSPIDAKMSKEDILKRIEIVKPEIVFTFSDVDEELLNELKNGKVESVDENKLNELFEQGNKLLEEGYEDYITATIKETDPGMLVFTSGTGGTIKAAVLSHRSVTASRISKQTIYMKPVDVLHVMPMFHIGGIADLTGTLMAEGKVYMSQGMQFLLKEFAYVKPGTFITVPGQAQFFLEIIKDKSVEEGREVLGGRLKLLRTCGAMLMDSLVAGFEKFDITVTSEYGMTESATACTSAVVRDGVVWTKRGSVGHIVNPYLVDIFEKDSEGRGEIIIGGPYIFNGYLNNEEATREMLVDGFVHTGDIGYFDEDGFLFLTGRKKNVIIVSTGENVVPEEIEEQIYSIDGVKECLVYSKDDVIAVDIYTESDEEYIRNEIFKINKINSNYKCVRTINFTKEPLKKTSTGKIARS